MTRRILKFIALPLLMAGLVCSPRAALADCTSPTGSQGEIFYNGDFNVMQFCDGTNWIGMYGGSGGGGGAGVTDGDKGDVSVSGSGASWMIDDDVLDFTEFKDLLTLDASTDISVTGSNVLSFTNSGTGNSLVVNDQASDATPFVIDAAGNVGVGISTPTQALDVFGKTASNTFIAKPVTGAAAPIGGSGGSGGGSGIQVKTTAERDAISSPATGMVIYNTTTSQLEVYSGSAWVGVGGGQVVTGTYTGNGAASRSINLGFRPKAVILKAINGTYNGQIVTVDGIPDAANEYRAFASNGGVADNAIDVTATGFTAYGPANDSSFNANGAVYHYAAFSGGGGGGGSGSSSGTAGYLQFSGGSGAFASSSTSAGQQLVWDTTNHRLGIGTATPNASLNVARATADAWANPINFSKSRSGAIVQSGDELGYIGFWGYDGAAERRAAMILSSVDGTPGSNDMPGSLQFYTTPDGTGGVIERMRISGSGNVGIGTATPGSKLAVIDGNFDLGGLTNSHIKMQGRGAFSMAAAGACLGMSGNGAGNIVWSPGTSQNCTSACSGASAGTCVAGWSVWSGETHYRYGTECSVADPSSGQSISGKYCCCNNSAAAHVLFSN